MRTSIRQKLRISLFMRYSHLASSLVVSSSLLEQASSQNTGVGVLLSPSTALPATGLVAIVACSAVCCERGVVACCLNNARC